ncbi:hypothetical protein HYU06_07450 [Candidatus Woesearchaeota archaeon]|nr:hypothetical protein [Candidatus Woesearchaeota archaeon]
MPSFAEYALQGIKKHPEIFSALEEFERTKKIPKFTYRRRIDVTINEHILSAFKKFCGQHNLNMSRVIENYMKQELTKENSRKA